MLKLNKPLIFTFNNRNLAAWFAMMKAVLDAGFVLEKDGVVVGTDRNLQRYSTCEV